MTKEKTKKTKEKKGKTEKKEEKKKTEKKKEKRGKKEEKVAIEVVTTEKASAAEEKEAEEKEEEVATIERVPEEEKATTTEKAPTAEKETEPENGVEEEANAAEKIDSSKDDVVCAECGTSDVTNREDPDGIVLCKDCWADHDAFAAHDDVDDSDEGEDAQKEVSDDDSEGSLDDYDNTKGALIEKEKPADLVLDSYVNSDKSPAEELGRAARNGNLDAIKAIIVTHGKSRPKRLLNATAFHGMTPLYWASVYGYIDVVEFLVDKGADINGTGKGSVTALMGASYGGRVEVCQYLLEKKKKTRFKHDSKSWSAFDHSRKHNAYAVEEDKIAVQHLVNTKQGISSFCLVM